MNDSNGTVDNNYICLNSVVHKFPWLTVLEITMMQAHDIMLTGEQIVNTLECVASPLNLLNCS